MSLIADGLLIATCLTAAVYCFVLGRRLKQFASTEVGLGQQIVQLNKSLDETRAALKEAQAGAKSEAAALDRNIAEARKLAARLSKLIEHGSIALQSVATETKAPVMTVRGASAPDAPPVEIAKVAALQAAAAVQLGEKPDEAPEPADEEDDIDPAEINIGELLAASAGEQQLGFLPDDTEEDAEEDDAVEPGGVTPEEVNRAEEDTAGHPDDVAEEHAAAPGAPGAVPNNLLKVERMAL